MYNKSTTISNLYDSLRASKEAEADAATVRPADLNPSLNKHAAPLDMHTGGPTSIKLPESLVIQQPLSRILWSAGLVSSRSEGQRLISNKGVYVGGRSGKGGSQSMGDTLNYAQIEDPKWVSVKQFVIDDHILILRTGKWRVKIIDIVPDPTYTALGLDCPGWKEFQTEKDQPTESSATDSDETGTPDDDPAKEQAKKLTELDLYGEELYRQQQRRNAAEAQERARLANVRRLRSMTGAELDDLPRRRRNPPSSSSSKDGKYQAALNWDSNRARRQDDEASAAREMRSLREHEDRKAHVQPSDVGVHGRPKIGDHVKERPTAGGLGVRAPQRQE